MRLCGTVEEHHLFCCDVQNLNRERSVESEERVSGERVGKTGGERVKEDERERERSSEESAKATDLCVCVCYGYGGHKSKGGNGSAESAFSSLQLLA